MITVRSMTENDLKDVALIHKKAYPADHFTSVLPVKLLIYYYQYILQFNKYSYIAESEEKSYGFVVAGDKTNYAVNKFIKDHYFRILSVLFKHPEFILSRIINYFKIRKQSSKDISKAKIRLLSIAVDPDAKGKGIATALINKVSDAVLSDGFSSYGLSVHNNNARAVKLYEYLGFRVEKMEGNATYFIMNLNEKQI